ncbi:MAG: universal stress protein [Bradymonadia bacterium]
MDTPSSAQCIDRVLVATDLSPASNALYAAARDLLCPGGTVHLVHVLDPAESLWSALVRDYSPEGIEKQMLIQAESALLDLDPSGQPLPTLEAHIMVGHPAAQIASQAEAVGADLILVGAARGEGVLQGILGHVADEVLRRTRCPTMVIPVGVKTARPHL